MSTRYSLESQEDMNHALIVDKGFTKQMTQGRKKFVIDNVRYTVDFPGGNKRIRSEYLPGLYVGKAVMGTHFTGLFTATKVTPLNVKTTVDISVPLGDPPVQTVVDRLKTTLARPEAYLQVTRGNRHWKNVWWYGQANKYGMPFFSDGTTYTDLSLMNRKTTWPSGQFTHSMPAQLGNEASVGFGYIPLRKVLWFNRAKLPIPTALFTDSTKDGLFNGDNNTPTYPRVGEGIVAACYVDGVPNPDNDNIPERQYRVIIQITTLANDTPTGPQSGTKSFKYARFFLGKNSAVTSSILSNAGSPFDNVNQQFIFHPAGNKVIAMLDNSVWEGTINAGGTMTDFDILRARTVALDAETSDTVLAADYDSAGALVYIRGISRFFTDHGTAQASAPGTSVVGWSMPGCVPEVVPGWVWWSDFESSAMPGTNGAWGVLYSDGMGGYTGPHTFYDGGTQKRIDQYDYEIRYNDTVIVPKKEFRYDFSSTTRRAVLSVTKTGNVWRLPDCTFNQSGTIGLTPTYGPWENINNNTLTGARYTVGPQAVSGDIAEGRLFVSTNLLENPTTAFPPGTDAPYAFTTGKLQTHVVDAGVRVRTHDIPHTQIQPNFVAEAQLGAIISAAANKHTPSGNPKNTASFISTLYKINGMTSWKAVSLYFYTPTATQDDWRVSEQFLTDPNNLYTGPVYF